MQNGRMQHQPLHRGAGRDQDQCDVWLWVLLGLLWCVCLGLFLAVFFTHNEMSELSERLGRTRAVVYCCDGARSAVNQCQKS